MQLDFTGRRRSGRGKAGASNAKYSVGPLMDYVPSCPVPSGSVRSVPSNLELKLALFQVLCRRQQNGTSTRYNYKERCKRMEEWDNKRNERTAPRQWPVRLRRSDARKQGRDSGGRNGACAAVVVSASTRKTGGNKSVTTSRSRFSSAEMSYDTAFTIPQACCRCATRHTRPCSSPATSPRTCASASPPPTSVGSSALPTTPTVSTAHLTPLLHAAHAEIVDQEIFAQLIK